MTTLVVGASGATGRLLVRQLLDRGQQVKVIVRSADKTAELFQDHESVTVIEASVLDLSDSELAHHARGCSAVASCLGHNLNFRGMFGPPRRLVTDATRRLCDAIRANKPAEPVKFVLMNTTANSNRDLPERISIGQSCAIWLLRLLLPPHVDNEQAADYLRTEVGQDDGVIEWTAVRPDSLIDESEVTAYEVHPSPVRSAMFDAGKTSRINTGSFMTELIVDADTWNEWRGRMPVIYNKDQP
jgi:cation diffusion facilitator CzcD-associated flavoprotein CzcO